MSFYPKLFCADQEGFGCFAEGSGPLRYTFNKTDKVIDNKHSNVLPNVVKQYIIDLAQRNSKLKIKELTIDEPITNVKTHFQLSTFLYNNFVLKGMILLSIVKQTPGWQNSFRDFLNTETVSICKSCNCKAHAFCCDLYKSADCSRRVMLLGWQLS